MLTATRGFNYGPDDTRVEAGESFDPAVLPRADRKFLIDEGVLVDDAAAPTTTEEQV